MKNKGYALLELVICIVLISMVIIQFTVVITKLNTRSHELFIQNKIENNIYNLYGEIGYDFINYNIKSINRIENGYVFEFYQVNKDNVCLMKLHKLLFDMYDVLIRIAENFIESCFLADLIW